MPQNLLTQKVIEFWENAKSAYPAGHQLEAADALTMYFIEESSALDLGPDFDPDEDINDDDIIYRP